MNPLRKVLSLALSVLLALTVGFGLLKQAKKLYRSRATYAEKKNEPGHEARVLRDWLIARHAAGASGLKIRYVTDRPDLPGQRPGSQYCYDAQYGFVPLALLVREREDNPDYILLDFVSEASVDAYAAAQGLDVSARSGAMALARRRA